MMITDVNVVFMFSNVNFFFPEVLCHNIDQRLIKYEQLEHM